MRNWAVGALMTASSLAVIAPASAAVYTADFSGSDLPSDLFAIDGSGGTQFSYSVGGGSLTVSQSATATPSSSQLLIGTAFAVAGDFSASVDLDLSSFIGGDTVQTVALFNANLGGGSVIANPFIFDGNGTNFVSGNYYIKGSSYPNGAIAFGSNVSLTIVRSGTTVTEYADGIELASKTDPLFGADATFFLGLNNYGGATDAKSITYSNFTITTPDAAVPEASTWAMMIGGVGLAGAVLRRQCRVTARVAFA